MCTRKNKIVSFVVIVSSILLGTTGLLARTCSDAPPGVPTQTRCCITFTGQATGGTFIFYKYLGGNAKCAIVETTAGESAEKVIERLADVIEETNPFNWIIIRGGPKETGARIVTSSGGELKGLAGGCGAYNIAGTETGLGIPQPPHSLTSNYNSESNSITLRWINPSPDAYDAISIGLRKGSGLTIPGNSENYVIDLNKYQANLKSNMDFYSKLAGPNSKIIEKDTLDDLDIWVYGVHSDIPSNAAAIHVNKNIQQELFGIPFTGGVAPNWQFWSLDANEEKIRFEEGKKEGNKIISSYQHAKSKIFDINSFCQVVDTGAKGGTGGAYRKFIGLTPGHTYRVKTRVATLSELNEGQWSVSVHASINGPDEGDFSPRQMAGLDALTDGNKGDTAGRMALFDSSLATKGQFVEISTDNNKTIRGKEITDITLPQGVDAITVWIRCTASSAMSAAIDWISLEDLSV